MSLKIGPVAADAKIDPTDPDDVGGISGTTGAGYDAMNIIDANSAAQEKLRPYTALPRDDARSAALNLDEISERIGDRDVEGASVRGSGDGNRVVVYLIRAASGRSARGVLPYKGLTKSAAAFAQKQKETLDAARAARSAGGSERDFGEDPRVAVLTQRLDELEAEKRDAEKRASAVPDPFDGFGDATVKEIREKIESVSDLVEREILKRQVRAAEESAEKPRQGVLDATEPVALAPVGEGS